MWKCTCQGHYLFSQSEFAWAKAPQYVATALGSLFATPVGNYVAQRVDKDHFKDIVRVFAFTGGCSMVVTLAPEVLQHLGLMSPTVRIHGIEEDELHFRISKSETCQICHFRAT